MAIELLTSVWAGDLVAAADEKMGRITFLWKIKSEIGKFLELFFGKSSDRCSVDLCSLKSFR